ncbi:MAG TPA: BrxA/BrxB family bacilliredoxin [Candidatus Kapabacteria bacterium]
MYDPMMIQPMRDELTRIGMKELRSPEDVDTELQEKGTAFYFINSVCGCAAGSARPAITLALQHEKKPEKLLTSFAGNDRDAVAKARSYFTGFPPSSPQMAILKDGKIVWMMERWQIEGRMPQDIAKDIVSAFDSLN